MNENSQIQKVYQMEELFVKEDSKFEWSKSGLHG
jgi:hypothetical protein